MFVMLSSSPLSARRQVHEILRAASVFISFLFAGALMAKPTPSPSPSSTPNESVLRAQLFLDASAFKPGAIDGKWGEFMGKALTRYEATEGKTEPKYGKNTPATFDLPFDQSKPLLISYTFSPNDEKFIGKLPSSHAEQAKAEGLPYENFLELVAEKFHARRDFLRQINPGVNWEQLKPGDQVQAPNIAAPFDVEEAIDLKNQTEHAEKADNLKTEKTKPESERVSIFVDVKEKILELKQENKLVASTGFKPGERRMREGTFQSFPIMAYLHDQQSPISQVFCGIAQYCPRCLQPIFAARQSIARLVAILLWQASHGRRADIWRVADNKIVASAPQPGEQIGLNNVDSVLEAVISYIFLRDRKRLR